MLNISENSINDQIPVQEFKSFGLLERGRVKKVPVYLTLGLTGLVLGALFLPWTQNIQGTGYVTTRNPDQRPQAIQSVISGRLERWYVKEGDFVQAGDTIVFLSEVKSEYFDPQLVDRTAEQVRAKSQSIDSYDEKVRSLESQYAALTEARRLKIAQTRNKILQSRFKIESDSMDLVALKIDRDIAEKQFNRTQELYDRGIKSLTELEGKKLKLQETTAKVVVQQNKLLAQQNELQNLQIELEAIASDYADKLAKAQSDKFSALSSKLDATATTSKLQNQLSNYSQRQKFYYLTAPQTGYITKAIKKGLGEIVKEGTDVVTIMPERYDLAVELYVKPLDLPLLQIGNRVRLQFDGWPAIVFSGWPNASFGTFSGKVVAIDRFISDNGKYRILISPSDPQKPWPELIRVGSGAWAFILLNDVPVWYELWRQLNGFPPDFYAKADSGADPVKRKAPLRSVK
ncbi:MAG: HlyD family efflux transporter periplasmic adaptor subunit [Saprospiraceae bacterium]|nr:HlyD family efflux transporter periplasmic adaptor subunit [Saprospiraceae bacterium]